jgi:O-antigen ligase
VSIDPASTWTSLFYLALVLIWAGACRSALSNGLSVRAIAGNVAVLGTVVGLLGLAQKATFNGKLLWFWTPQFFATNSFGPFVNRNHFAGWMILAVSISIGLLFARGVRSAPSSDATWRERVLWLGSPAASPVMVIAAAVLVMSCSLVWTMSRSGMIGAATALTAIACAVMWRHKTASSRWLLAGFVLLIGVSVVAWRGTDRLVSWYGNTGTLAWRVQLWKDTAPAVGDYWLTGSGLNTYSSLMMVQPRTDLTVQPRQAHNDYLQLAVEGGLLLAIPALLLIAAVGRAIVRALTVPQDERIWWIRMGAVAGIIGIAVQEISEFSLQIPAVSLLFATCVAIAIHEVDDRSSARKLNRRSKQHTQAA